MLTLDPDVAIILVSKKWSAFSCERAVCRRADVGRSVSEVFFEPAKRIRWPPYKYDVAVLWFGGSADDSKCPGPGSIPLNHGKQAVHAISSVDPTAAATRQVRKLAIGAICTGVLALAVSLSPTMAVRLGSRPKRVRKARHMPGPGFAP